MNAEDEGATISLQSAHQREVPKRMSSVKMRANHSGHLPLEIGVCPLSKHDLTNVVTNVEVRVRFPCGQANVEGRKHGAPLVKGDEMEFRLNEPSASFEGDLAFELACRRNVQWLAIALQVQEKCVSPGKGTNSVRCRHSSFLLPRV